VRDPAALDRRIRSIVRAQALLRDGGFFGSEPESAPAAAAEEYAALLDYRTHPESGKLRRLASIVRAHGILFGAGLVEADESVDAEVDALLRHLAALAEKAPAVLKRSDILPGNLGSAFVRKGLGAPLFGPHRPRAVPSGPGLILSYQAIEAAGVARISATAAGPGTGARYAGFGVALDSSAPWLHCVVAPEEGEPTLAPRPAFARKPTVFRSDSHAVYLAAAKARTVLRSAVMDPFHYQYVYFFFDDGTMRAKVARFLGDLFCGLFGFTARDAEPIARAFIERSS
jgi:hypothetical protein